MYKKFLNHLIVLFFFYNEQILRNLFFHNIFFNILFNFIITIIFSGYVMERYYSITIYHQQMVKLNKKYCDFVLSTLMQYNIAIHVCTYSNNSLYFLFYVILNES